MSHYILIPYPRPPNVLRLRALWSPIDGIRGVLEGIWGVLENLNPGDPSLWIPPQAPSCEIICLSTEPGAVGWDTRGRLCLPRAGRITKVDPLQRSIIYTMGVLESRIGGSILWILAGVRVKDLQALGFKDRT